MQIEKIVTFKAGDHCEPVECEIYQGKPMPSDWCDEAAKRITRSISVEDCRAIVQDQDNPELSLDGPARLDDRVFAQIIREEFDKMAVEACCPPMKMADVLQALSIAMNSPKPGRGLGDGQ